MSTIGKFISQHWGKILLSLLAIILLIVTLGRRNRFKNKGA